MTSPLLTVITPTTGRRSLDTLVASINQQSLPGAVFHILLWDDRRAAGARPPADYAGASRLSLVLPAGAGRHGDAPGSALRAVGLMAAATPWVTFADDDVRWEPDHADTVLGAVQGFNWAASLRHVWSQAGDYLGVDRFESIGDAPGRRVPYEMLDNNCMLFRRELGTAAAVLYRETRAYNDDRLMYDFLKSNAGACGHTARPTLHHTCPARLEDFFRAHCAPA